MAAQDQDETRRALNPLFNDNRIKLGVFALVTIMASYVLVATITNAGFGEQLTYKAQFSDVDTKFSDLKADKSDWKKIGDELNALLTRINDGIRSLASQVK